MMANKKRRKFTPKVIDDGFSTPTYQWEIVCSINRALAEFFGVEFRKAPGMTFREVERDSYPVCEEEPECHLYRYHVVRYVGHGTFERKGWKGKQKIIVSYERTYGDHLPSDRGAQLHLFFVYAFGIVRRFGVQPDGRIYSSDFNEEDVPVEILKTMKKVA